MAYAIKKQCSLIVLYLPEIVNNEHLIIIIKNICHWRRVYGQLWVGKGAVWILLYNDESPGFWELKLRRSDNDWQGFSVYTRVYAAVTGAYVSNAAAAVFNRP